MTSAKPNQRVDASAVAIAFFACVLREAGFSEAVRAPVTAPLRPARVVKDIQGFVAYSGGARHQYDALEKVLTEWLGEPKVNENRMGDLLIGRRAEFSNGVSLVYMPDRDGGITFNAPAKTLQLLEEHVVTAMDKLAERGGNDKGRD
jgi:hypothetical protein